MIGPDRSPHIEPIHAPAADEPTRSNHDGCLKDDGSGVTEAWGKQQDANGPEDKADYKDDDRIERARLGRPE